MYEKLIFYFKTILLLLPWQHPCQVQGYSRGKLFLQEQDEKTNYYSEESNTFD